jgi:radical SAM superfamily enzyme YgiQ (UPF0313 family)
MMIKFAIYDGNKTNIKEYPIRLIKHLFSDHIVDDPLDADVVMVSLCDITEIGDIQKARRAYGKPVLAGGIISEYPLVNELADYTYHGEIYGLYHYIIDGNDGLGACKYVSKRGDRVLNVCQTIDWELNPVIQVGSRAKYYYVSKGCPMRCKYCYIGNSRKYQAVPRELYRAALGVAGKNIMPIAAFNPYGIPQNAGIGETMLKEYIKGNNGDKARTIRTGVEFVTKELSEGLAKGVTIEELNNALRVSKNNKTKLILYFIAGLETQEDLSNYFNCIDLDYDTSPSVTVVFTYLDPQPFTPFCNFDIRQKIEIDAKEVYRVVSERNKRFRVMPLAKPAKSTIRTMLARCTSADDYQYVVSMKKLTHQEIMDRCDRDHLIGTDRLSDVLAYPRKSIVPDYWDCTDWTL